MYIKGSKKSLVSEDLSPGKMLGVLWNYMAHDPCEAGSEGSKEENAEVGTREEIALAREMALSECVERLVELEGVLRGNAYCCGDAPGVDDFMRFPAWTNFMNVLDMLGMSDGIYEHTPSIKAWCDRMSTRESNPFVHSKEVVCAAWGPVWAGKVKNRKFPDVKGTSVVRIDQQIDHQVASSETEELSSRADSLTEISNSSRYDRHDPESQLTRSTKVRNVVRKDQDLKSKMAAKAGSAKKSNPSASVCL